jgi:protoheme IX farnesyltransferase
MSDTSIELQHAQAGADGIAGGSVGDYFALLKPRVMSLVIFTGLVGLVAAPGSLHPVLAVAAILCIAVGAGAAGALNMWYDADIDAEMQRTAKRPIPTGRVAAGEALTFGATLASGSVLVLGVAVNWTAAALLGITIGFYLFIYTMWLKRRTPQNIVIGGAAGAFPPMIGWAAATGTVDTASIVLFLVIFMWTPPHFWALALCRTRDYERARVPMLPVVAGPDETRRQIGLYSLALVATSVLPTFAGIGGAVYLAAASGLGLVFLVLAFAVFRRRDGPAAPRAARRLFSFSILYLFALFAAILVEQGGGFYWAVPWSGG